MQAAQPGTVALRAGAPGATVGAASPRLWTLVSAHVRPLSNRLGRGEGQLAAINWSLIVLSGAGAASGLLQGIFCAALLAVLYMVNDVIDAPGDRHDPGKDQVFVATLVRHRPWLLGLSAIEHLVLPLFAWAWFGWESGAAVASVLAINAAYSFGLKGVAFVDAPVVALWGLSYAMVVDGDLPWRVYACVGLMTMVTHVFQILRDRPIDSLTLVRTSAVAHDWLPTLHLAVACVGLAVCLAPDLGPWGALSALAPLLLHLSLRSNQVAWLVSKAYFGVVWLMLLYAVAGG